MTPAQAARAIGCKSLRQVSEASGVPVSTLRDWFESRRFVFDAVCHAVDSGFFVYEAEKQQEQQR